MAKRQQTEDPKAAAAMVAALFLAEPITGLGWGLRIERRSEPRDWPAKLAEVPLELRPEAERYLRDRAAIMRAHRALTNRSKDGPPSGQE